MPDPYLEAMLRGEFARVKSKASPAFPKSPFDCAAERHVDEYIHSLALEEEAHSDVWINPLEKKNKVKREILGAIQLSDFTQSLAAAIKFLTNYGQQYQPAELHRAMQVQFERMQRALGNFASKGDADRFFLQELLALDEALKSSILNIAIEKYAREEYQLAMDLLVLLTLFETENGDYWYRLGIAAQKCQNYNLAIRSYAACTKFYPESMGAHLFAVECYLRMGEVEGAKAKLAEAQQLAKVQVVDAAWMDYLAFAERTLS